MIVHGKGGKMSRGTLSNFFLVNFFSSFDLIVVVLLLLYCCCCCCYCCQNKLKENIISPTKKLVISADVQFLQQSFFLLKQGFWIFVPLWKISQNNYDRNQNLFTIRVCVALIYLGSNHIKPIFSSKRPLIPLQCIILI